MKEQEVRGIIDFVRGSISDDKLLEMLQAEHQRFLGANPNKIQYYIDALIGRGVYPKETVPGNLRTVYDMVNSYGAYWHKWRDGTLLECPHCKADLRDLEQGPPGIRTIGMVDRGTDRIESWQCPDCKGTWSRDYTPEKA
jgi:hypothetical protein